MSTDRSFPENCNPEDIAVKSFFLGPQAENAEWFTQQWIQVLQRWISWRRSLFPQDPEAISPSDQEHLAFKHYQKRIEESLNLLLLQLEAEVPKFTPRYMGHMMAESSIPALIGHIATLLHNPNITTREVSKVTTDLETQAIRDLAQMIQFPSTTEGHFTSGGTVANIEALWRARFRFDNYFALTLAQKSTGHDPGFFQSCHRSESNFEEEKKSFTQAELLKMSFVKNGPWKIQESFFNLYQKNFNGPIILVPGSKHFSWQKAVSLLGLGDNAFWTVRLDAQGRMSVEDLRHKIEMAKKQERPILMVVSILGSTELATVDPLHEIQKLLDEYKDKENLHLWHHVDAAYGGYFCSMIRGQNPLIDPNSSLYQSLDAISLVDSVTLDPHKLGYVPYSCGAILTRDRGRYPIGSFLAPYLTQENQSRWAFTLEGSRASTGAVATWLSNRTIGLDVFGYGRVLQKGIQARKHLQSALEMQNIPTLAPAELNILCFHMPSPLNSLKDSNLRTQKVYKHFVDSPNFSVSKTILSDKDYSDLIDWHLKKHNLKKDDESLFTLRVVLMNPFFASKKYQKRLEKEFLQELLKQANEIC